MATLNVLGMTEASRRKLMDQAKQNLAAGDDSLATQLAVTAAKQLSAQIQHHADEIQSSLRTLRDQLTKSGS